MQEGEVLDVVEEDKGDGWTRVRKNNGDEGYIPTSYVAITLNKWHTEGIKTEESRCSHGTNQKWSHRRLGETLVYPEGGPSEMRLLRCAPYGYCYIFVIAIT